MPTHLEALDGNEAVARVAHRLSEVVAIYPITPASPMGEHADAWSAQGRQNLWGQVPQVVEMQSEGGAAGAVHGALQAGALATSFTASQGLLLMLPNMYKIAGELTPFVLHVAARTLATHALSIFCDHSDVMACRGTGFAVLFAGSVQEAHDLAAVAHAATLRGRVPFLHVMDGFRTSHELATIAPLDDDDLRALVDEDAILAHRARALDPDRPVLRGTAQNPDVFFQAREAASPYYAALPGLLRDLLGRLAARTGRRWDLVEWVGHPEAERGLVLMGSAAETARETVERLAAAGERVGALVVRLFRPFPQEDLLAALPASVRRLAVLDRTKEPGAPGEPLYLDVAATLRRARRDVLVTGGRYGLGSKELTPEMLEAALAALAGPTPPDGFTLGITDDVGGTSLPGATLPAAAPAPEPADVRRAVFFGLGSDGTVGSSKQVLELLAARAGVHGQGYSVYDSKKSGAVTVSHLRLAPRPIRSAYLIREAGYVGVHQWALLDRLDPLALAAPGATVLVNAPHAPDVVWDHLPREAQAQVLERGLALWCVDAHAVAREAGLPGRIGAVMQAGFLALTCAGPDALLPREEALDALRASIEGAYGRKGRATVQRNLAAIDLALARLRPVPVGGLVTATRRRPPPVSAEAPDFVRRVTAALIAGHGDALPVSAFPPDGTWPTATSRWERRGVAQEVPRWHEDLCIECNKCALMCPHAAIRAKLVAPAAPDGGPGAGVTTIPWKGPGHAGAAYALAVAPDDCTGCGLCVQVCPAKDKAAPRRKALEMVPRLPRLEADRAAWAAFVALPEADRRAVKLDVKGSQLLLPLFEFSGACAGCGETPYLKLLSQLVGDRLLVANATGCSSIFGGNLPTTPWATDAAGRGPAWSNSLFEDNAEFGLGLRLGVDARVAEARDLLARLRARLPAALVDALLAPDPEDTADPAWLAARRADVAALEAALEALPRAGGGPGGEADGRRGGPGEDAARLRAVAGALVPRSLWIVGGDGWAYDIGFGGLDHVLAQDRKVNVLVLDTEVYSNTGGQQSKATPRGATAKFASAGKAMAKKDLGLIAMSYGHVYVARVAIGAKDAQTVKALQEAERHPGPSLVLAYSPCIAHGYDLAYQADHQKLAVDTGAWPLYRFDPRRVEQGLPPLVLDGGSPKAPLSGLRSAEARFALPEKADPRRFERLAALAQADAARRWGIYEQLAGLTVPRGDGGAPAGPAAAERG